MEPSSLPRGGFHRGEKAYTLFPIYLLLFCLSAEEHPESLHREATLPGLDSAEEENPQVGAELPARWR